MAHSKDTCPSCGDPLGNTVDKCHECGGRTYRSGPRETGETWRIMLGVSG